MAELRWNPLLRTWVMVASNRQNRPNLPRDNCPFCPGSGKVPDYYDVLAFDNDFPVMSPNPPEPDPVATLFYKTMPSHGKCEVILYSSQHAITLQELSVDHIHKLVKLWKFRCAELSKDPLVKYVFPFENKGEEVGATIAHPHGQIYAYPFIPLKLETEYASTHEYFQREGKCLFCRMNEEEHSFGGRMVYENASMLAYIPFFTDYPWGVFLVSKRHVSHLTDFSEEEERDLAEALKVIVGSFDALFDRPFPYMMVMHQGPVNHELEKLSREFFHWHIEFYPPLRARDKIKFYASSEMGAWAAANVVAVEQSAKQLRDARLKFFIGWDEKKALDEAVSLFVQLYGGKSNDISIYRSPARVNLIGEHIDYNGGWVFPAAINRFIYAIVRKRSDRKLRFASLQFPGEIEVELDSIKKQEVGWVNYPLGVVDQWKKKNLSLSCGLDVLFVSNIPAGSGVSSSAAFEVVFATALNDLFDGGLSPQEIALLCQRAENEFVGVSCGIMDQFAVAMGKKDHALLLHCDTLEYKTIPVHLEGYVFVLTNSNKKRELVDSAYNTRLAECGKALEILRSKLSVHHLCDLSEKDLVLNYSLFEGEETLYRRAYHVVTENERTLEAAKRLQCGDVEGFGKLLNASHDSLRENYEVTGEHLDALVELARRVDGCIGSRMTGAGFGGCTVSLVAEEAVDRFKKVVGEGYKDRFGITADFLVIHLEDGAKKILL